MSKQDRINVDEQAIQMRRLRRAVGKILEDYEQTAKTLDTVTAQVGGLEATDHAGNVQSLKSDLLSQLQSDSDTISPPWEREGYDSKEAWLVEQE
jgi:DNA repair exonuclease SbcCD ATPase subunit